MIEIGKTKTVTRINPKTGEKSQHVCCDRIRRITRDKYGHTGKKRKFVVIIEGKDLITIKPFGTRTQTMSGSVYDIWFMLVRGKAEKAKMEKLRKRKEKLKEVRAKKRLDSAERRFRQRTRQELQYATTTVHEARRLK